MSDEEKTETEDKGNGAAGEEDLVELALEKLAENARAILSEKGLEGPSLGEREATGLGQFVMAADLHFLVEELTAAIDGARRFVTHLAPMAQMAMGAGLGAMAAPLDPSDFPAPPPISLEDLKPGAAPGAGPSWVKSVLEAADQMDAGKKRIAIDVVPGDQKPLDDEHKALIRQMRTEGWPIEKLKEALLQCDRPAEVRILKDPAAE
jgi:hypothetical protein